MVSAHARALCACCLLLGLVGPLLQREAYIVVHVPGGELLFRA